MSPRPWLPSLLPGGFPAFSVTDAGTESMTCFCSFTAFYERGVVGELIRSSIKLQILASAQLIIFFVVVECYIPHPPHPCPPMVW